MKYLFGLFCLQFLLTSCFSKRSTDPDEAYKLWAGIKPPKEVEVLNGQFYQSPHFTLEYEVFLKIKAPSDWWARFINSNQLEVDRNVSIWSTVTEYPEWYLPNSNFEIYSRNDEFDRSRYLYNPKTSVGYIYETVGM